jgi:hypothetical protein
MRGVSGKTERVEEWSKYRGSTVLIDLPSTGTSQIKFINQEDHGDQDPQINTTRLKTGDTLAPSATLLTALAPAPKHPPLKPPLEIRLKIYSYLVVRCSAESNLQ